MARFKFTRPDLLFAVLVLTAAPWGLQAAAQDSPSVTRQPSAQTQAISSPSASISPSSLPAADQNLSNNLRPSPQPLFEVKDSDFKFSLDRLMSTLRDSKHEGWVLAAYPDPKTSRPLIGAGFSLDVAATAHIQSDPLNPNQFLEPSSAQLWQSAGLDPEHLQQILDQFNRNFAKWKKKNYRKKIKTRSLRPQVSEEEATRLLRISAIQAIHNAKAYCRHFDQLTAPEQIALSQLVFQMGVNLEEFVEFLSTLNDYASYRGTTQPGGDVAITSEPWQSVQRKLIESQWARRYSTRAAAVIAMFDPEYVNDPSGAERRVLATLDPPARHHRKKAAAKSLQAANGSH